jgi:hypothetical protein
MTEQHKDSINVTAILVSAIIAFAIVFSVYIYTDSNRYSVNLHDLRGFVLDKKTGQAWFLMPDTMRPVPVTR